MRDLRISTRAQQDEYKVQPEDADVVGGKVNVGEGEEVVVDHTDQEVSEGLPVGKADESEIFHEI